MKTLWLMVLVVFLSGCLGNKEQATEASGISDQIGEQSSRIQSLESSLGEFRVKSAEDDRVLSSLTEYVDAVKNSLEALSDSQDALKTDKQSDLKALTEKIDEIAVQVQRLNEQVNTRKVAPVVSAPTQTKPVVPVKKKAEPPFIVLGIEYRGQEPFLALIDKSRRNLSDVMLFQPADFVAEDWRLISFDATRAVFFVDGQDVVIALP
jgi:Mor family transcriptional regulator